MRVTLIQGGGMGLDQVPAVKRILEAAGVTMEWDEHLAGWASMERGGAPLPEPLLKSVRETGLALKTKLLLPPANIPLPKGRSGNFNVRLRQELGLFAAVRPLKNLPGLSARFQGVDMLVVRELTEDLYAAIEHEIVPGVVQSLKVVTEAASRRFFRFAFEWARASRPQDRYLRSQGEYPQARRRAVPRSIPHHGKGLSGPASEGNHRGQLLHAAGVQTPAVRRSGDG